MRFRADLEVRAFLSRLNPDRATNRTSRLAPASLARAYRETRRPRHTRFRIPRRLVYRGRAAVGEAIGNSRLCRKSLRCVFPCRTGTRLRAILELTPAR